MNSIIQQITDWLKGLLVSGIMNNLTNTFSSVNDQVGQIATEVGQTPSSFLPAVFNMVRNLSETVIMPIAGILLTFIACYELIQLIISYNNLASFETWFIFKWIFKTFVAVELITHTFDITMAVFDVSQSVVSRAGGIIQGSTAIDASTLATMQTTLETMDLGPLLGIFLQSFVVQFLIEARPFTVRENARCQMFPDSWEFCGNVMSQYKQVGNAVPVSLAHDIAIEIKKTLELTEKEKEIKEHSC